MKNDLNQEDKSVKSSQSSLFGMLRGKAEIKGDIISPTGVEWDVNTQSS